MARPLQNGAAMVRTVLLLSVAALLWTGSPARADDGGPPGLVLERAASDPLPHWEVHLGGGVGAARVAMLGSNHGAVAVSIDQQSTGGIPHTGLGLYLGEIVAAPWRNVEMDDHPVVRELPIIIEPELVHRSIPPPLALAGDGLDRIPGGRRGRHAHVGELGPPVLASNRARRRLSTGSRPAARRR